MTKPFCLTTYLIGFFGAPDPRVVKPKAPVHRVACRVCGWYVASVVAGRSTDDSKYWQVKMVGCVLVGCGLWATLQGFY